jgi:Raf kinase inhibitor-like YbhB/YbcL family protein
MKLAALALALVAASAAGTSETPAPFQVRSTFGPYGPIPIDNTCDWGDTSPAIGWRGVPAGTKSLALIMDDPDAPDPAAPKVVWVHWVVYDIPADALGLPKNATRKNLPKGTRMGINDWKQQMYRGPCPPVGEHRYFFKLYALDVVLPDLGGPTKADLEKAMEGHVLGKAELVGKYKHSVKKPQE